MLQINTGMSANVLRFSKAMKNAMIVCNMPCKPKSCVSHMLRNISTSLLHFATERYFTDKHEWICVDGSVGTVGITNYAQDSLGDVVYAQLPDIGTGVKQKDECGALESVKAASELYSPVSGKVLEKNSSVEQTPGLINISCYDKGWLFKVELSKPDELKELMTEKEYEQFLKSDDCH